MYASYSVIRPTLQASREFSELSQRFNPRDIYLSHFRVRFSVMANLQKPELPDNAKILIAEDERDLAEMLAYNLEKKGYLASLAENGSEAWNRIESDEPNLLILDLMMPKMDGWELCRMTQ